MYNKTSNFKFQISNSQRGVSLIITLFIMIIILLVVLSISTLLYSEIKVLRNVGNSVIAFYAADSGVEKVLYYDRQWKVTGATRGICDICNVCDDDTDATTDCFACDALNTSTDAAINGCTACTNCKVTFKTNMDSSDKKYNTVVNVSTADRPGSCPISTVYVESYGTYLTAKRAINLNAVGEIKTGSGPSLNGSGTEFQVNNNNTVIKIVIVASSPVESMTAYIYKQDGSFVEQVSLIDPGGDGLEWKYTWTSNEAGVFYISAGGIDADGSCTSVMVEP